MQPGIKGQNTVTGILKKNLFKRSQILQGKKNIQHHTINIVAGTYKPVFEILKPSLIMRPIQDFPEEDLFIQQPWVFCTFLSGRIVKQALTKQTVFNRIIQTTTIIAIIQRLITSLNLVLKDLLHFLSLPSFVSYQNVRNVLKILCF